MVATKSLLSDMKMVPFILWVLPLTLVIGACGGGGGSGGNDDNSGTPSFSVGGNVTGLASALTLTLQNNAGDDLTLSANGSFEFATDLADGAAYAATVLTQPTGQTCTIAAGTGTIAGSDVTDVAVNCAPSSSIGGALSGLSGTGTVILQNNGDDDLALSANGPFAFTTGVVDGAAYAVTVLTQPAGQICTVTNGTGTVSGSDITNVAVACVTSSSVGGAISGLSGTVVLQNNAGDDLSLSTNGPFTFPTNLLEGAAYAVTVLTPPTGQSCTVTNGTGTVAGADVTNIMVACGTLSSVGGTVSGLSGTVVLQNNAGDDLTLSADGSFTFGMDLAMGANYAVTVLTQPAGQICTVTNGTGTIAGAVTNVAVDCSAPAAFYVYVANQSSNDITTFSANSSTGELTEIDSDMAGTGPISITTHPNGQFAYVANIGSNNVTTFSIDSSTGMLTVEGTTAVVTGITAPHSVTVHPTGQFAYVANLDSDNVTIFSIDSMGGLSMEGTADAGDGPVSVTVTPNGEFAYVANEFDSDVTTFSIDSSTGMLTAEGVDVPAGDSPASITVDPAGEFAYVAAQLGGVTTFSIAPSTGMLTGVGSAVTAGTTPISVAVDPAGEFAYVANFDSDDITIFPIDSSTGALIEAGAGTVDAEMGQTGSEPFSITVDPTGQFAYVANQNNDTITTFSIDSSTGGLMEIDSDMTEGMPSSIAILGR